MINTIKLIELIKLIGLLNKTVNLGDQMHRASLSLKNSIAKGHGKHRFQENIQFCRISRGSLMELIDDLNFCIDEEYFPIDYMGELKAESYTANKLNQPRYLHQPQSLNQLFNLINKIISV